MGKRKRRRQGKTTFDVRETSVERRERMWPKKYMHVVEKKRKLQEKADVARPT